MVSKIVQVIDYEEPIELLAALRGSNDEFWNETPETWLFRGHADASWELLPSVLRRNSLLTHHAHKPPGPYADMRNQIDIEAEQVLKFATIANRQGLAIPGGWNSTRRLLSGSINAGTRFPPSELWDLFALAQHHGVPTRLLDWSRRSLVAAYFAAHGAASIMNEKKLNDSLRLGVWALDINVLTGSVSGGEAVYLVDPPRHGNQNLLAQDGAFTVHVHPWKGDDPPLCEAFDETVDRITRDLHPALRHCPMRLLTLPGRKARKLLARLEAEGVSASALFPGYDGVVRALFEEITHSQSAWRSPAAEE